LVTKELRQFGEVQSAALPQLVEKRDLMLPGMLHVMSQFIIMCGWKEGEREEEREEGKNWKK